jgi:hypothetical protein
MNQGRLMTVALAGTLLLWTPALGWSADGDQSQSASGTDSGVVLVGDTSSSEPIPSRAASVAPIAAPAAAQNIAATDSCNSSSLPCNEPCEPKWVILSGVDETFLHAKAKGLSAGSTITGAPGPETALSDSEVFDKYTFSPRVFAGVGYNDWGVVGRFWYLSDSSTNFQPFSPGGDGSGIHTSDELKAYTVDLEGLRTFYLAGSQIDFTVGARYASFTANQSLDAARLIDPTAIAYSNAFSRFEFSGVGITASLQGRTPIGIPCLNAVWGVRGSVLWSNAERSAQTDATMLDANTSNTSINSATSDHEATAFIVEAMAGLQYDHELRFFPIPVAAYVRIAAEYQHWDFGNNGEAASFSIAQSVGTAASSASVGDVHADLLGFMVGCGFNW